jgi:hypothetical protein
MLKAWISATGIAQSELPAKTTHHVLSAADLETYAKKLEFW